MIRTPRILASAILALGAITSAVSADDFFSQFQRQLGQVLMQGAPPPPVRRHSNSARSSPNEGASAPMPPDVGSGPSFSCSHVTKATEKAICASPKLSRLDLDLAEAFTEVWTAANDQQRADLKSKQRTWLAERARCGRDPGCIGQMMKQRTAELFALSETIRAESGAPAPAASPSSGEAGNGQEQPNAIARGEPLRETLFKGAPSADYRTLLAMMIDFRPDDYRSDDFAVYWYGWNLHSADIECTNARNAWRNVATREAFVRDVRSKLDDVLSRATKAPSTRPLRLSIRVEASQNGYDATAQKLTLNPLLLRAASQDQEFHWSRDNAFLAFAPVSVDHCYIAQSMLATQMLHGLSVSLDLARIPEITLNPSDVEDRVRGAQIGKQNSGLNFKIDLTANVGISDTGIKGHILAASVSDPVNGSVLANVDGDQLTRQDKDEQTPSSAPRNSEVGVPALNTLIDLVALRFKPDLISQAAIEEMTLRQIRSDQNSYQEVRRSGATGYGGGHDHQFVFSAAEVADRSAEFVMPSLVPKMRAAVAQIAAKAPTRFWTEQSLGPPQYDHARQVVTFNCCYARDTRISGEFEMLTPGGTEGVGANMSKPAATSTAGANVHARATYGFMLGDAPEYAPNVPIPERYRGTTELTRLGRSILPTQFPNVVLGLDRVLEIKEIHVDPTTIEAAMKRLEQHASVNDSIHSRIAFTVEDVIDSPDKRYLIVLAHLDLVTLLAPDDTVLAEVPVDSFPLAADRWNQLTSAAANAAEDAARTKSEQTKAEAERSAKANADAAAAVEQGRASVEAAAERALERPYGPDIVGVQLGMTFEDADAIIRKAMNVHWVLTNPATPFGQRDADLTSLRGYFNEDHSESIALLDMPPEAGGRVLGITRVFTVAHGTSNENIEAALVKKYGNPDRKEVNPSPIWRWGHDGGPCGVPVWGVASGIHIIEGPQPTGGSLPLSPDEMGVYRFSFPTGGDTPELAVWADCGPSVEVSRNGDRIRVVLADNRLYAAFLAHELRKNVEETQTSHPIKF